jgi:serralysin
MIRNVTSWRGWQLLIVAIVSIHTMISSSTLAASGWTITQLTNNDTDDYAPAISGTNVVWQGWDGSHSQIYSNFAGQLTNGSFNSFEPAVSGANVVWSNQYGRIYSNFAGELSDYSTTFDNVLPAISGTNVVWAGTTRAGNLNEIFSNFAGRLTNNTTIDWFPAVSGTNVVWVGSDGFHSQIYSNFAGQLTNDATDNEFPAISGTNVVWRKGLDAGGGADWEIWSNFAGQLTNNSTDDTLPDISGTNVVWLDHGRIATNFTDQLYVQTWGAGLAISGMNVVWTGTDGHDSEIYMATYDNTSIPAPGAALLACVGAGLIGWLRRGASRGRILN